MKNLFTLFISFLATVAIAQNPLMQNQQKYFRDPNSPMPSSFSLHHNYQGVLRTGASSCDTSDFLDYNTYNEVIATQNNLNFNGSWNSQTPSILAQEITPFVDTSHAGDFTYAEGIWDSIAFGDLNSGTTLYYPLSASTMYLDSLGMFIGIGGDTLPIDGKMTHDSLVFSVYSITGLNISQNPVKTVVFSGYAGLEPFFKGTGYLGYVQVGIGQQFTQGQAFAIRMDYLAKDTSSHLLLSYTYADSCGTVVYQGQNLSSPAYPSPFVGSSLWGHIYFNQAGTGATVQDENSGYAYTGLGFPVNCSFVYTQNWEFLPIINVCVNYGTQIQASPTSTCPGGTVNLNAAIYGTQSQNVTFSWASSGGTITDPNSQSTTLVMPDSSYNITVILTANDGVNGNVYDTMVIVNNAINVRIVNANPISINCGSQATVTTQVTGVTAGKTYAWSTNSTAATISVNSPGPYTVTVTNSSGCTASAGVNVEYAGGISNNVNFTNPNPPICAGKPVTFTNTSSDINNNWTATWSMGDLGTVNTINTAVYTYSNQGIYTVTLAMDSANCTFTSPAHSITVLSSTNSQCTNGIQDITFDDAISLLPNPTNGSVNVVINGVEKNVSITVYNIIGSQVANFNATDVPSSFSKTFDFSDLASGTYLVKIQSADKTAIKKLVINK